MHTKLQLRLAPTITCETQGSILSPLLFVVYINDLPQNLLKSSIDMDADDTVIYFSDCSAEIIKQVSQKDLNNVEK